MAYRGDIEGSEKLKEIRALFEEAVDHTVDAHREAHRASRFYHNSECEGQWDIDDLKYLREQQRPAFTFNLIKPKIDTFMGMYADAQRAPEVAAASGQDDDVLLAKVINIVKDQTLEECKYERLSSRQFKTGTIDGECALQVEVEDDDRNPGWSKINMYRVLPFEIHWDVSSIEPDRSDARYVFWDRWLSKSEFRQAYPDHIEKWDWLRGQGKTDLDGLGDADHSSHEFGMGEVGSDWGMHEDYDDDRFDRYYYDRRKNLIRVVRYEYKSFETRYYVKNMETGQERRVESDQYERAEQAVMLGAPYETSERVEEVVMVCEFVGMEILAEYDNAGPFKGFSLVSYCYDIDEETGTAYGPIRNLFDPQMEFNKGKSLEIEYMAQSAAPGVIAEEDAINNLDSFRDELRQPGGVALVKKGKLSEGAVIPDRPITPPSAMVAQRTQGAMQIMDEVSTIPQATNLSAAEHGTSGVHTALRYNKSRQAVSDPFANFEDAGKRIVDMVSQIIVNVFSDDQIESILSSDGTYDVQDGVVYELMEHPQQPGQMVPKAQAPLRGIRNLRYNLDMEYTSENSTLRMMELEIFMAIETVKPGSIDPEIMFERASSSRSTRERLKTFHEEQKQASAAGQAAQAEAMQKQTDGFLQVEMGKVQETQRHNKMQEQIKLTDQQLRARLEVTQQYIDADADEKKRLLEMAKFALDMRNRDTQEAHASA